MGHWCLLFFSLTVSGCILVTTARISKNSKGLLTLSKFLPFHSLSSEANGHSISPFDHCETLVLPDQISRQIQEYRINLDLPPEERWKDLVREKRKEILELIENIKRNSLIFFGRTLFWMVDKFIPRLTQTLPKEYVSELQGISKETGVNLGEITLFNLFYEFFSVCTSIVARSKDGSLYHGRNLDFGLFLGWDAINHTWQTTEFLRPLVVHLSFTRGDKVLYQSVNYAGYIGILTAVKRNKFSLSIDERFTLNGGYIGLAEWIVGMHNQSWIGFLARESMEKCETFECAQKMLSLSPLIAPVYFILTGIEGDQGCIITRGRKDFKIWHLGRKQKDQSGDWFMVQTNYDQWKSPPFYDDRRAPAIYCMDRLGQEDVPYSLANVLSTRPVLNKLTTYTTIMSAKEDLMKVWLQFCPDPCWPW